MHRRSTPHVALIALLLAGLARPVAAAPVKPALAATRAPKPAATASASARPTPATPTPTAAAKPSSASTKPEQGAAGVLLTTGGIPGKYTLDGTLTEWELEGGFDGVRVGIDARRVVLAITWAGPSRPNLALGLATVAPVMPSIGWSQRGGLTHELSRETCAREQIPLIEAGWADGRPNAPEVAKACNALLARHAAKQAEMRERFVRRIRVEGETVSLLDANRKATPIAAAKVRWGDKTGEVELPLSALPALREAPLQTLLGGIAFGPTPAWLYASLVEEGAGYPIDLAKFPGWSLLPLTTPANFGRHPDLLASVFGDAGGAGVSNPFAQTWYTADKPETLVRLVIDEVTVPANNNTPDVPGAIGGPTGPDRPTVTQREEALAAPLERLGDVEVVLSYGSVATLRAGKLVAMSSFSKPDATTKRGPNLHLFRYTEGGFSWIVGHYPPTWSVAAVLPDGSFEDIADEGVDSPGYPNAWDDIPQTFHAPDWTNFGMRGKRNGKPKTVTWRWSAAEGRYTVEAKPPQNGP